MTEPSHPRPKGGKDTSETAVPRRRGRRTERWRRRDLVTWVALGLLVAIVLGILSKATTAPHSSRHVDARRAFGSSSPRVTSAGDAPTANVAPPRRAETKGRSDSRPAVSDPTTTMTTAPSTSTTLKASAAQATAVPPPTTSPATSDQLRYSGALEYPDDIASSIPFASKSGVVAVRVNWSDGNELVASLRCPGAHESAPGTHGISISLDGSPGTCVVSIALGPGVRAHVAYVVTVLADGGG